MTPPRSRLPAVLLLVAAAAGLLVAGRWLNGHFDLKVYYGATRAWLHGEDLYGYVVHGRDRDYGFTYPPFGALLMAPAALLPWPVAGVAFDAATIAATLLVLRWLRPGSGRLWLTGGLLAAFALDPWRTTYNYGQVNLLLLAMVAADLLLLVDRRRGAGVLIGLAAAVKLTPAIFILYLLLTRRWRAAATAGGTALGVTLLMAAFAPRTSWRYWTDALWHGDRIGDPAFVSNQSLNGLVSRLGWSPVGFVLLALAALGYWAVRIRADRDVRLGLALTGVVACLVSPITWVHHLVWLGPAIVLLVEARAWVTAAVTYGVLCSRVVWRFNGARPTGVDHLGNLLGADAYLAAAVLLLVVTPPMAIPRRFRGTRIGGAASRRADGGVP